MAKTTNMTVKEISVRTLNVNGTDYISITDIARQKNPVEPKDVVKNWMRLKNTLEYLALWEQLNNLVFKGVEIDPLLRDAGSNSFTMSPTRWVELTGAIKLMPLRKTSFQPVIAGLTRNPLNKGGRQHE